MKKYSCIVILAGCLCLLVACGGKKEEKKVEPPKQEASETGKQEVSSGKTVEIQKEDDKEKEVPPQDTKQPEEKSPEEKEKEEKLELTKDWVKMATFSEGKLYRIPWLNEEVFGELAVNFNKETEEYYQGIKDLFTEVQEEYLQKQVDFFVTVDVKTNTYSLVSKMITINGNEFYRTFVVDLSTKKPLDFMEAVERAGLTKEEVRAEVEKYYSTIYASASYDYLVEGEVDLEMEDYIKERMGYFEDSILDEVPLGTAQTLFSLEDGYLNLHTAVRVPGFGEIFFRTLYIRKDIAENAILNGNYRSIIAKINRNPDSTLLKGATSVAEIATEAKDERLHFISIRDGVKLRIANIVYDETTSEFKELSNLYEGELKKGEMVTLDTIIPEGFPILRIVAEYTLKDEETGEEKLISYQNELGYNGRYEDPIIEYLDGVYIEE